MPAIGLEMAVGIILGVVIGQWLDKRSSGIGRR